MAPNDRGRFDGTNYDLWDDRGVGTMDERPSPDLMEDPYDPLVAQTVPFSFNRRDVMRKSSLVHRVPLFAVSPWGGITADSRASTSEANDFSCLRFGLRKRVFLTPPKLHI